MLCGYFDETVVNTADADGGKLRPSEMFVGGCIATTEQWEKFLPKWKRVLDQADVKAFHAKDFYAFQGEFKWFTPKGDRDLKRHGKFRDKLTDIIVEYVDEIIVFTSMAPVSKKGVKKAYEDATLRVFFDSVKFKDSWRDSLYIILARHPEFGPWSILKRFEQIDWEQKLAGCGIFYPDDVPQLQAADFVLHSLNKRWGGLETASFKRLQEGCLKRNKQFRQQEFSYEKITQGQDFRQPDQILEEGRRQSIGF